MRLRGSSLGLGLALGVGSTSVTGCGGLLGDDEVGAGNIGGTSAVDRSIVISAGGAAAGNTGSGGAMTAGICATGGTTSNASDESCSEDGSYCNNCYGKKLCSGATQISASIRWVNALLVVEASALMNNAAQPTDTQSRWTLLTNTVSSTLRTISYNVDFGLELFPYSSAGIEVGASDPAQSCAMPTGSVAIQNQIVPGTDQLTDIIDALNRHTAAGNAPLAQALDEAYNYFEQGTGQCLQGYRSVILVTTGAANCNNSLSCGRESCVPNIDPSCPPQFSDTNCCTSAGYLCSDDAEVVDRIHKLASAGIRTLVLGMPASDAEVSLLNRYADAGQQPNAGSLGERFYWLGQGHVGEQDLLNVFATLTTQLIKTCDIELTGSPQAQSSILVDVDCNLVPESAVNGWTLDESQNLPHVRLNGTYCEAISALGAMHVDIFYDCDLPQP